MEEAIEQINQWIANGGVFAEMYSRSDGELTVVFTNAPNQQIGKLTLTVSNVDDKDVSVVTE